MNLRLETPSPDVLQVAKRTVASAWSPSAMPKRNLRVSVAMPHPVYLASAFNDQFISSLVPTYWRYLLVEGKSLIGTVEAPYEAEQQDQQSVGRVSRSDYGRWFHAILRFADRIRTGHQYFLRAVESNQTHTHLVWFHAKEDDQFCVLGPPHANKLRLLSIEATVALLDKLYQHMRP
jgi:hypothetical protein